VSAFPLMRSKCVRTSIKATARAPTNRPDTYQRCLQPRQNISCEQQSVHTFPHCNAFDIRRSPDLCGFCSRQACLRFCGRKAHRCYSRANTLTALGRTPVTAAAKVPVPVACVTVGIECSGYLQLNGKPGRNRHGCEEIRSCVGACDQQAGKCLPIPSGGNTDGTQGGRRLYL
jgi:hypothetical protein